MIWKYVKQFKTMFDSIVKFWILEILKLDWINKFLYLLKQNLYKFLIKINIFKIQI